MDLFIEVVAGTDLTFDLTMSHRDLVASLHEDGVAEGFHFYVAPVQGDSVAGHENAGMFVEWNDRPAADAVDVAISVW